MRKRIENLLGKKLSEENKLSQSRQEYFQQRKSGLDHYAQDFNVVAQINGVTYINHAQSQSVDETFDALQKIKHPVILIIGGLNGLDNYSLITGYINDRIDSVILIGNGKEQLLKKFEAYDVEIFLADDLDQSVFMAYRNARENYVVLFSPASIPVEYKSLEERSEGFKNAVEKLL